ncbi:membrane-associated oxidoreductase [Streptomyces sp. NPDC050504]|uniref:membrane-associated oxidoreductase n=1 Tax=Streptomyces sp. NPDC050504 TaxID=3365618 RepID=UPI0037BCE3DC
MEITELSSAERRVWEAVPRGEPVDFRTGSGDDPLVDGPSWGPERTVRGEVLRALLLAGPVHNGEVPRLRLGGARISGVWNLQYGTAHCSVRLSGCHFDEEPVLYGAQFQQLSLVRSVLPGLSAATVRVDGALRLSGSRFHGTLRLGAASVSRRLFLDGTHLGGGEGGADDGTVLKLSQATVADDIVATGLVAHGEVRLNGATVTGHIDLSDSELHNPSGTALQAKNLSVGTDLRAMRLRANGRISLRGAQIPGQLNLAYAALANPDGVALRASGAAIGELWLRESVPIEGTVNLRRAQINLVHAVPSVWPDRVQLDELTYRSLVPHLPAKERIPLVERDLDGYVPYSYEQLTAAYRRIGDDAAARTVQLAKQRRHRATLPGYARVWGYAQDAAVGYGFRPVRAAAWLTSLVLVGAVAYGLRPPKPLKADEAPEFNPLFYTLDLLLPIVDFGQEKAFAPAGWYQWLGYALIVTGWLLATAIAAGVTRTVSRQ